MDTSALPESTSRSTVAPVLYMVARWRGVSPLVVRGSTVAPASNSARMQSNRPLTLAWCRAVLPSSPLVSTCAIERRETCAHVETRLGAEHGFR